MKRKVISVLVGALNGKPPISYSLHIKIIESAANHFSVQHSIQEALQKLWPDGVLYSNFKFLLTDQAAYNLKASQNMKRGLYPELLHVTCACHALHRVCLEMVTHYIDVQQVVNDFCIIFNKSGRRVSSLEDCLGIKLANLPCPTRWGTWVMFVVFLNDNYDSIIQYIETIKNENNMAIRRLIDDLPKLETRTGFVKIKQMSRIAQCITELETSGLSLEDQKNIVETARANLDPIFQDKLDSCFEKNPDYVSLSFPVSQNELFNLSFAPITSVDVERSFSQFKNILTDRRDSFLDENFALYAAIHYNSKLLK